jgi:hypothetical protein
VHNDPNRREPRAPAVAVWTLSGLLVGVAGGFVLGSFALPVIVCGLVGLGYGLFTTRRRQVPEDD